MATLHPPTPISDHEALIEIYAAVQEIQKEQARVATDLRVTLYRMEHRCDLEDHRLSLLEKWRATITGGLIVVGIVAGAGLGHILKLWLP